MISKNLSKTDVAKASGVSRAAVTKWFHQGEETNFINMEMKTLTRFAESTGIQPELLLTKLDVDEPQMKTIFLWDALYPSLAHFVNALHRGVPQALARLVQVVGFHQASFIGGKKIIQKFPMYKKFIKPVRRLQLEKIWPLYLNR
ncbi:MAG: hypothetical protein A2048_04355 [Deltaproteobacteria bacterium GWA2_45_12]|nr:MAG: hypothetical protein A2048_04355 [Deltaproteobacteria bacterium GWA2_45_12]